MECALQFWGFGISLAFHVTCRELKSQRGLRERIWVKDKMPGGNRANLHSNVSAIAQRQRVQQVGRLAKVYAGKQ